MKKPILNFQAHPSLFERIDRLVDQLNAQDPYGIRHRITRSDVIRMGLDGGLPLLEKRLHEEGPLPA